MALGSVLLCAGPAHALQDPTRPPGPQATVAKPAPERSLALDSILFSKDRRVAVIEGEALREGQGFDNVRVIRIYTNRVLVMDNGRERVLYLERLPQVRGTQ
jgi:MSHA biogenesis protein MshK